MLCALNLPEGKWSRLARREECWGAMAAFLTSGVEARTLAFYVRGARNELHCTISAPPPPPPGNPAGKMVCFVRRGDEPLLAGALSKQLMVVEVLGAPWRLDQMAGVLADVYAPFLCGPRAQRRWPPAITSDLARHLDRFQGVIQSAALQVPPMTPYSKYHTTT